MTRKDIRKIINEEIIGRYIPSPLKKATRVERDAELVIKDFVTECSQSIKNYVNERAGKYHLDKTAVSATIAALNNLFTKNTLNSAIIQMHNIISKQTTPFGRGR